MAGNSAKGSLYKERLARYNVQEVDEPYLNKWYRN